jgi:hypothetical protein
MSDVALLLAAQGAYAVDAPGWPWRRLLAHTAAGGLVFGAAMGSFSLRSEQMLFSALKVPLFLGTVTLISLPSLFALHLALGLRQDFPAALRAVAAAQATLAAALAAFAPLCLFVYASSASYRLAVVADGGFFAAATLAGQVTLLRHGRGRRGGARHLAVRLVWGALYAFVGIQTAWVLRPFVGAPGLEPAFLRADKWTNAYVVVARTLLELLQGRA